MKTEPKHIQIEAALDKSHGHWTVIPTYLLGDPDADTAYYTIIQHSDGGEWEWITLDNTVPVDLKRAQKAARTMRAFDRSIKTIRKQIINTL